MLRELRIENLLLIERAELRLGEGLNVITGETGAGKTVLAHSLDLLMGGRARPQIVRPGASEAWVEGTFDLPEGLLADPDLGDLAERISADATDLVLGRRVSSSGRTSAFVGGRSATAADLKMLGSRLLAFYGQHEHRRLTIASAQMEILDGFAGPRHLETRNRYRDAYREQARIVAELEELHERDGSRERDLDLYRFELGEIEAVATTPAEVAGLVADRDRLRHAEGLRDAALTALEVTTGGEDDGTSGGAAALGAASESLRSQAGLDAGLDEMAARLTGLALELEDLSSDLRGYLDGLDSDPGRLVGVEERLDAIDRLSRKHGGSVEAVLEHAERCRAEIARLEGSGERTADLESALADATVLRDELAAGLTDGRSGITSKFEKRVAEVLDRLAMSGASIEVVLRPHPDSFGPNGAESVELRLAPNPGIEAAPLGDAASGGELSRVMLALTGLGDRGAGQTLVFDEIDAGIGGKTARVVGERLRDLGTSRQVICITHLAQVASLASVHFRIAKSIESGATRAEVERVEDDDLIEEICRMLGATSSDEAASRHARELLAAA